MKRTVIDSREVKKNAMTIYWALKKYEDTGLTPIEIIRKHMNDKAEDGGWIPVEERLPENSKHKGSFCPRYLIDTKYGVTEGWYNSDVESWYCLFWFMTMRYLEHEIDFEKGDVPKVIRVTLESDIVIAWKPLPEPYRPQK